MREELNNYSTVNEQLKSMTNEFLSRHSSLTVNALAQRSGVAATTLRRLMQDESKSDIAPHTVLALVSYLLREKSIAKILKIIDGPVAVLLRKSFDQFIFNEQESEHKLDQELNNVFKDKLNYLIYKLAANVCGVTTNEIRDNFGLHGLQKLENLIQMELIIVDENGVFHAKEKDFTVDLVRAHELTHVLVDQYKPTEVDKGFNLFYSLSEGMSLEGIKEVKRIELEAVKKVHSIMNDKNFLGKIPYYAIFLSDVIGINPCSVPTKEVLQ